MQSIPQPKGRRFVFGECGVGVQHCICKEAPCRCNNGWGCFETEEQLFAEIEAEIKAEAPRWREADIQAVQWLRVELSFGPVEISETLGIREQVVRRILRVLDK